MDDNAVKRFKNDGDGTIDVTTDAEGLLQGLEDAFGSLPPYRAYATNWLDEDEFGALGSWETWKFDTTVSVGIPEYYEFFQPRENGRLIISGSASCLRHWGYMMGAYYAGIKSAEWAIRYMDGDGVSDPPPPPSQCDDPVA